MQSFRQYITELFDKSYEWKWAVTNSFEYSAKFQIDSDIEYGVDITNGGGYWEVEFGPIKKGRVDTADITNEYYANKILSTVIEITIDFVKKEDPNNVKFSGDKSNIGRASVYSKILKRELPDNYNVEIEELKQNTLFRIKKRDD